MSDTNARTSSKEKRACLTDTTVAALCHIDVQVAALRAMVQALLTVDNGDIVERKSSSTCSNNSSTDTVNLVESAKQPLSLRATPLLTTEPSSSQDELARLRWENTVLQAKVSAVTQRQATLESEKCALREVKDALQADHNALKGRYEQLQMDFKELLRQNEQRLHTVRERNSILPTSNTPAEPLTPQSSPQTTVQHQPYLTYDPATAGPNFDANLSNTSTAYPSALPVVQIPEGVVAEVLEFHSSRPSTHRSTSTDVLERLSSMHTMAEELLRVQAYSTTALFVSLGTSIRLTKPEDLYTLWRAFGGKESFTRCRSRINALLSLLDGCNRDAVNIAPSNAYLKEDFLVLSEEEVKLFVSVMLSRLPRLRTMTLRGYASWPLPSTNPPQERVAFPSLNALEVLDTPWHPEGLRRLVGGLRSNGQKALRSLTVTKRLAPADCDTAALLKEFDGLLRYK